jgi:hypothetical protein
MSESFDHPRRFLSGLFQASIDVVFIAAAVAEAIACGNQRLGRSRGQRDGGVVFLEDHASEGEAAAGDIALDATVVEHLRDVGRVAVGAFELARGCRQEGRGIAFERRARDGANLLASGKEQHQC